MPLPVFTKRITSSSDLHRIDFDSADHGRLSGIQLGHDQPGDFLAAGFNGDGKGSAHSANAAVERQLSYKKAIRDLLLIQAAIGAQDSQRHGQVEARALLADVGGSKIDGDVGGRDVVAAVF